MELKKISLILLFVIFANYLKAEIIKPKKDFSAYEVVKIQLNALQKNDELKNDLGIKLLIFFIISYKLKNLHFIYVTY